MKPSVSLLIPFKKFSKKVGIKYDPRLHEKAEAKYPRLVKRSKIDGTIIDIEQKIRSEEVIAAMPPMSGNNNRR